ncbi:membrane-targeted effector domain-containing toxin [Pseudomonas sp. NPDC090233]|uniref:membrane-targeted effector domain-containing toxin n=1 Tax=Pseudomonas sp. NPDC090233 TaxID=3364479 RepID=UPI00383AC6EE
MTLTPQQSSTQQTLRDLATQVTAACPDIRQAARKVAQAVLSKFGHTDLDPDKVYLHRFKYAHTSPRTFNGWAHNQAPYQSYTLPQLVMHRFDVHDQDNADLLTYLTGFYTDGPEAESFDEHNELAIAPRDVLEYFWQIDFCSDFKQQVEAFWAAHSDDYRVLAKVNFLSKVLEERASNPGSPLALQAGRVATALVGDIAWPPTLEQLRQQVQPSAGLRVGTFDIGGHVASDILRVEMLDGQQLLYLPGEVDALHLFASHDDLYWWLLNQNNQADNRSRFMGHFPLESHAQQNSSVGLNHMIDLLFFNWGGSAPSPLNQLNRGIDADAFSHLRDSCKQRMLDDERFALRSNADLRKQLWIGYLRAFGEVSGALAALDWPVALAAVGAGLAETGLNIDQAITGHITAERQAGVVGAILAAVNTLFNATFLLSAPGSAVDNALEPVSVEEPLTTPDETLEPTEDDRLATRADLVAWVPEPLRPAQAQDLLAPFETNVLLNGNPGSGELQGIYTQDGKFYALIDELPYEVRHVGELNSWVVIDPENPFSFARHQPIRLGPNGQWEVILPPSLKGGMPASLLKIFGRPATTAALPELPPTPYEIPIEHRPLLEQTASLEKHTGVLKGDYGMGVDSPTESATETFRQTSGRLATDAHRFVQTFELPPRPPLPQLTATTQVKALLSDVFEQADGLVIGESHSDMGSKRFLIDNMKLLRKQNVKVLYMEHFLTDIHQADLDVFNRTGVMSERLLEYADTQGTRRGLAKTNPYTFTEVLRSAQKENIRIQSIDCMASYWEIQPAPLARQEMMNYYAHLIIDADQATRGKSKWVALMGNSHSNTFEGVPGVSEIQGAYGLRIEDVPMGQPERFEIDPGQSVADNKTARFIKGDIRLQAALKKPEVATETLEELLREPGDYHVTAQHNQLFLIHRSGDGSLVRTPIQKEGNYYFINRPKWAWISGQRFSNLSQLRGILSRHGMVMKELKTS